MFKFFKKRMVNTLFSCYNIFELGMTNLYF